MRICVSLNLNRESVTGSFMKHKDEDMTIKDVVKKVGNVKVSTLTRLSKVVVYWLWTILVSFTLIYCLYMVVYIWVDGDAFSTKSAGFLGAVIALVLSIVVGVAAAMELRGGFVKSRLINLLRLD